MSIFYLLLSGKRNVDTGTIGVKRQMPRKNEKYPLGKGWRNKVSEHKRLNLLKEDSAYIIVTPQKLLR